MEKLKNKRVIIIIVCIVVLVLCWVSGIIYMKNKQQKEFVKAVKEDVTLNAGYSIKEIKSKIRKIKKLGDDIEISLRAINDNGSIEARVKYFKGNKEVDRAEAYNSKGKLKDGYTKKEFLIGIGKYKIVMTDTKTKKSYTSSLIIEDKEAPSLKLQNVEIEEGSSVDISRFIKSCSDNSFQACKYEYVDDDNKKIDKIDTSVGERNIKIVAIDSSNNRSKVKTAKLKVNAKKVETPTTNNNNSSGNNNYDTSNPIVAKALSLVGSTMDCTQLVELSLNAAGKNLWRTCDCSHPIFKEPDIAKSAAAVCADSSTGPQQVWGINVVKYFGTPVGSPSPGDILFYESNGLGGKHIAVYIGGGQAVHGGWTNNKVAISSMYFSGASSPVAYRM